MSHRHFCDHAGHYWECNGVVVRQFAEGSEPTPCVCSKHSVSMNDGDHSECPIELLACPEHRKEHPQQMIDSSTSDLPKNEPGTDSNAFTDKEGKPTVGFCLWCNRDFYTDDEVIEHNGNGVNACPEFRAYVEATDNS
jgi:hypothetical protein